MESVAICLINSYENPVHEAMTKALVNESAPDLSVSASYEVLPQIREYERTCTTATQRLCQTHYGQIPSETVLPSAITRLWREAVYHAVERQHYHRCDGL